MKKRTVYCGQVTPDMLGQEIVVQGWVQKHRDLGGVIFADIRDREGLVQVVFNPDYNEECFKLAESIRPEFVVAVTGTVVERSDVNPNLKTGMLEIEAHDLEVYSTAKTPPIYIEDELNVADELRMKYRYLDIRRKPMLENLRLRHQTTHAIRNYLDANGYMDVETPYLTKSTPEGARDYLDAQQSEQAGISGHAFRDSLPDPGG